MKKWDIYKDKFIANVHQELAVLIVAGIVVYDYATPEARVLYDNLTELDKNYILTRIGLEKEKRKENKK